MNVQEIKETESKNGIQAALDAQMKELVRKELSTRIQPILHELRDDCRGLVADLSIGDLMKKSKATNGTNGAHVTAKRRSGRKPMLNADQVADIPGRCPAERAFQAGSAKTVR